MFGFRQISKLSLRVQTRSFAAVPSTMKAAVIREVGGPQVMKIEKDYPVPKLDASKPEVLVKNQYSGINFIDTYHRSGLYARDLPFVGGQEGGGTIAAVTPEAEKQGWKTYSEYAKVPAGKLINVPKDIPMDVAVSCVVQGLTAHYLTASAHANLIKPGEWMLIHGVGGGTCQWAAQMAKAQGYKVIGTVSKAKEAVGKGTGCDELIVYDNAPNATFEDYASVDGAAKVQEITGGKGVKAVIDGIGLATWEMSIASLAVRGIFVSFGNASGAVPAFPPLKLIAKSGYLTRPKLLDYTQTREEMNQRAGDIFRWIAEGKLKVTVDKAFPLDQAVQGHEYLEAGKSTGKVLYKIE